MRPKLTILFIIVILAFMLAPLTGASSQRNAGDREYAEREDINQTYELAPGARVELSVISGSVDVETTSGNTAEVSRSFQFCRQSRFGRLCDLRVRDQRQRDVPR